MAEVTTNKGFNIYLGILAVLVIWAFFYYKSKFKKELDFNLNTLASKPAEVVKPQVSTTSDAEVLNSLVSENKNKLTKIDTSHTYNDGATVSNAFTVMNLIANESKAQSVYL